jgi:hypothetical protein
MFKAKAFEGDTGDRQCIVVVGWWSEGKQFTALTC